jgi:hypothetical protein
MWTTRYDTQCTDAFGKPVVPALQPTQFDREPQKADAARPQQHQHVAQGFG